LSADDQACAVGVRVVWHARQPMSICLTIVNRPEPGRCWEEVPEGVYELELRAAGDVTFELRDAAEHRLLAAATLRVVRETNRYRHKRREPWNVFD
jgi:hypothetical protein